MLPIKFSHEVWGQRKPLRSLFWAGVVCWFLGGTAWANLVIVPTFDSTITSDVNAAAIEGTISNAIALYQASFSDSVTVKIAFHEMTSGLGQSSSYYIPGNAYADFRAKLAARASTANDSVALAHLPTTTANPVNGSTTLALNLPNGRALGYTGGGWNPPVGESDGDVYLNMAIMNLTRTAINPAKYDLFAVAAHEIDEVLGLTSVLDGLNNGDPTPTGDINVLDLFRYDQNGSRSFNTTLASQAYFSLDGTNKLVRFNQDGNGDFQDWYSSGGQTPRVQDAYSTAGATPNLTVELIALDVIGYHLIVPSIAIAKAGSGKETISWSPVVPGFYLQEKTNLLSTNWINSASGTNTPVTITNTAGRTFYRIFHP